MCRCEKSLLNCSKRDKVAASPGEVPQATGVGLQDPHGGSRSGCSYPSDACHGTNVTGSTQNFQPRPATSEVKVIVAQPSTVMIAAPA